MAIDSFKAIQTCCRGRQRQRGCSSTTSPWTWRRGGPRRCWSASTRAEEIGTAPEFAIADGIVRLTNERQELTAAAQFEVLKLRGANYVTGRHFFDIGADGVTFYPRVRGPAMTVSRRSDLDAIGSPPASRARRAARRRPPARERDGRPGRHRDGQDAAGAALSPRRRAPRRAGDPLHAGGDPGAAPRRSRRAWVEPAPLEAQGCLVISYTSPVELSTDRFLDARGGRSSEGRARAAPCSTASPAWRSASFSAARGSRARLRADEARSVGRCHAADDHGGRGACSAPRSCPGTVSRPSPTT